MNETRQKAPGRLISRARTRTFSRIAAALLAAGAAVSLGGVSSSYSAADGAVGTPVAQPVIGLPVSTPTLIGATPGEKEGETWGYATGSELRIVRYIPQEGWRVQPQPQGAHGESLSSFQPAPGPLAGRTTPNGGVAIVGEDAKHVGQVLVRDPEGPFQQAPTLTTEPSEGTAGGKEEAGKAGNGGEAGKEKAGEGETGKAGGKGEAGKEETGTKSETSDPNALLRPGETLFEREHEALITPVDLEGRHTGVFLVPFEGSSSNRQQEDVLFYDGTQWNREPICVGAGAAQSEGCAKPQHGFKVLAIDASSKQNAWLLARSGSGGEGVVLLGRETNRAGTRWTQRTLGGALGAEFSEGSLSFGEGGSVSVKVAPLGNGQPLTVTDRGVWVDGQLTISGQAQPSDFTLFYEPGAAGSGQVAASWCEVPAAASSLCSYPLEAELPAGAYRSFAWSEGGPYGERVITGLDDGASLSLQATSFVRVRGAGGESGTRAGAAFSSPTEGWLANAEGGPLTHLTTTRAPNRLQAWPVPFRRPLTAIAEQAGATPGDVTAEAISVGQDGQVARYVPNQGWVPEALLSSAGVAQTPNMRGVAWPEPGRAYAVGTHGAMWLWQRATGLWEPDPARPPNLFLANFTGIAFDPSNPSRGYAIGQQGVLLGFGKSWAQEPLPEGLQKADFTSIAFAGDEALVTYQIPHFNPEEGFGYGFSGGLLVNDGTGWRIDTSAAEALGKLGFPERVAGLPDGGAVMAAGGQVFERQSSGAAWEPTPAGRLESGAVALAAFREGGRLRAAISVLGGIIQGGTDVDRPLEQAPPEGQAPVATEPYPLPSSGYVLRETSTGWEDEEHEDFPLPSRNGEGAALDWPDQPDAVLAFALSTDGTQGWAVGGQTGEINNEGLGETRQHAEAIQTAGVMRYPASGAAPVGFSASPEETTGGDATFAIGGGAQCVAPCADLAEDHLGPDAWLASAVSAAAQTPGVRAFLYAGAHVAPNLAKTAGFGAEAFQREEDRYSELLSTSAGSLAVFAAPSESDLDQSGKLASFDSAFGSFGAPQGVGSPANDVQPMSPASPEVAYYSFDSTGSSGTVRVVVLDYSSTSLGLTQQCWLAEQLAQAKGEHVPAIVIGNRAVDSASGSSNAAADSEQVVPILVRGTPPAGCPPLPAAAQGGASAYFFEYPEQNRSYALTAGSESIPAFGTGTLGYVQPPAQTQTEFLGASGFLLAEVEVAKRDPGSNRAPVSAKLIPDISDLAIDATNGVLLRRSQSALFSALARRPHAGMECTKASASCQFDPDPYVPIPDPCQGPNCASGLFPTYTFTSSNPDVGDFVQPDPAEPKGEVVLQGPNGKPISDPHSGLFCAYNPGTTTVTIKAGGLSSSEQITVQAGSVEQPCGTVPLRNPPAPTQEGSLPVPLPAPAPTPAAAPKGTLPPPPPAPPAIAHSPVAPPAHPPHRLPAVPQVPAQLFPVLAIVPPPSPSLARPTPPSGTAEVPAQSPVSQTVGVEEHEEQEERATEMVHHMAAYDAYGEHHPSEGPLPPWTIALVLVAVAAGLGMHRARPELARLGTTRRR